MISWSPIAKSTGPLDLLGICRCGETDGGRGVAMTSVTDVVARAKDALTVRRVFGEPIERDGVTIVPVARFLGAGGTGTREGGPGGRTGPGWGSGSGGGYGLKAVPAGFL